MWNEEMHLCLDYSPGYQRLSYSEQLEESRRESERREREEAREKALHIIDGIDIRRAALDIVGKLNKKYAGTQKGEIIRIVYERKLKWEREYEQKKAGLISEINKVGLDLNKLNDCELESLLRDLSRKTKK